MAAPVHTFPVVHTISMVEMVAQIDLRIRFERTARARLWLGIRLMQFAAFVAGCGVTIEVDTDKA